MLSLQHQGSPGFWASVAVSSYLVPHEVNQFPKTTDFGNCECEPGIESDSKMYMAEFVGGSSLGTPLCHSHQNVIFQMISHLDR